MNVLFIGKSHEFSLVPFEAIRRRHRIVGVVESGPRGKLTAGQRIKARIKTALSAFDGRSLRWWARRDQVPFMWLDARTRHGLEDFIGRCRPDILVVASLSHLLSERTLSLPPHGAINLHPSALPRYHGPFPWLWQYLADEPEIGVTVHKLDAGQDTGPIIKQVHVPLKRGTDVLEFQSVVAHRGAELICEALEDISTGRAQFRPHSLEGHSKARVVRRDEALIDWSRWPIERVWHALRGSYPWLDPLDCPRPLQGGRYRVDDFEPGPRSGIPGHVYKDSDGYFVAHDQGRIRLRPRGSHALIPRRKPAHK